MIITKLQANHFRKYETLQLNNLPTQGLIIVAGGDEAGKSSIGEAILFALFGRTEALEGASLAKLVLWGGEAASVTLYFQQQTERYCLQRDVSAEGIQQAKLWQLTADNAVLADTPEAVNEAVQAMLGIDYDVFVRTFFWGQADVQYSLADEDSLHAMMAVKTYLTLGRMLEQERCMAGATLQAAQSHSEALRLQHERHARDPVQVSALQSIRQTLHERRRSARALQAEINNSNELYAERYADYQRYSAHSRRAWGLIYAGALLLAGILLLWGVQTFAPVWGRALWPFDPAWLPQGRELLWIGSGIAVATVLAWLYDAYVERRRLEPLRLWSALYGSALRDALLQLRSTLETFFDAETTAYLQQHSDIPSQAKKSSIRLAAVSEYLPEQVRAYATSPEESQAGFQALEKGLLAYSARMDTYVQVVDQDVGKVQSLEQHYSELAEGVQREAWQVKNSDHQTQVLDKSIQLLYLASQFFIQRFNQSVQQRCEQLLNEFTAQRIDAETAELDQDFALQVLSKGQNEGLELDAVSPLTRRQVNLAMRVAVADALLKQLGQQAHFVFMDAPVVGLDTDRTQATLRSLAATQQGRLAQIWLTMQTVPEQTFGATLIHCELGEPRLQWQGN